MEEFKIENLENEEWKMVQGYDQGKVRYAVSNMGRVKSIINVVKYGGVDVENLLNPSPNKGGYLCVDLRGKTYYVHRLVVEQFIPEQIEPWLEASHEDNDKSNCKLSNLKMRTHQCNMQNGCGEGKHPGPAGKMVKCIETGIIYDSVSDCARQLGVNLDSLYKYFKGKSKSVRGNHYIKLEEEEN